MMGQWDIAGAGCEMVRGRGEEVGKRKEAEAKETKRRR